MKRKIITILIGLLSISIAGIIIVQLVWIRNAIYVKEELFMRNASEAMQNTVKRLETLHDVMIINRLAFPDSALWLNRRLISPPPLPAVGIKNPGQRLVFREESGRETNIRIEIGSDSLHHFRYEMSSGNKMKEKVSTDGTKNLEEVIVLRKNISGSFDSMKRSGLQRLDSLTEIFDTLLISPHETRQIHLRASNLKNVTQKAVNEIIALDKPDMDQKELESILAEELQNRNIPIPFQYAVIRDSSILLTTGIADTTALLSSPLKTELFPSALFRRNQQLTLYFPDRETYIYRSMSWLLLASFLFSVIVLITFAASVLLLLRQKRISEMKSDFINNMTHEFKTPIATIAVAADSLLKDKVLADREMIKYFSEMIRKENKRMNRQVEDILTIARLEKKEMDFSWQQFDVHELLNEVIEAFRVQVVQRDGHILSVYESTRPLVVSDRKYLAHAVLNLLDNANKYSPEAPHIMVRTADTEGGVLVSVTDKGIGMTRQVQARIFERFYRQSSGNIHNVKGFGLGLSYTRAVVEAGKGWIRVQSEPGKGSRFELFLPSGQ